MASRRIEDLHPKMQPLARQFEVQCLAVGITVLIYCTLRSIAEQDQLYAQGRNRPGKIVTNARGGDSWHNWGLAFDFVPLIDGQPAWNAGSLYGKCGEIGEKLGLEWAGRWIGSLRETAHMQLTLGRTISQLKYPA